MKKQKNKISISKLIIRIVCFALAFSMVATTFFVLIQYLMDL